MSNNKVRRVVRLAIFIVTILFLLRRQLPFAIDDENEFYISIAAFCILIPLGTYELIQVRKEDRLHNTQQFKIATIALAMVLLLFLGFTYISLYNQP